MNAKKYAVLIGTTLCMATGPVLGEHNTSSNQDRNTTPFTKENIGKAVGAAAGALLGSQFGGGKGRLAAVAVGTLAGYWVGGRVGRHLSQRDRTGIAQSTHKALETGNAQTWNNPDTGVSTRVSVRDTGPGTDRRGREPVGQAPTLELINEFYYSNATVNVRGGPGTNHAILYQLEEGERVPVVGKVVGRRWMMLANRGQGGGFVYAPLLSRSDESGNAIRETIQSGEPVRTYSADNRECRFITQEVVLPDDTSRTHEFKACRQPDGSWAEV